MKKPFKFLFPLIIVSFLGHVTLAQRSLRSVKFTLDSVNFKVWIPAANIWDQDHFKTSHTYDLRGNLTESILISWSGIDNRWIPSEKFEYTYDSDGNKTSYIIYSWSATNTWESSSKTEYAYNSKGLLIEIIHFNINRITSQWVNFSKTSNQYNGNDQLNLSQSFLWNEVNNQWDKLYQGTNTYNTDTNLAHSFSFSWDTVTNEWDSIGKTNYDYFITNNLKSVHSFSKSSSPGIWHPSFTRNYLYNQNDQIVAFEQFDYNLYLRSRKIEYIYDIHLNLTEKNEQTWDPNSSSWVNAKKSRFTYDNIYGSSELIVPKRYKEDNLMNHMLLDHISYNWNTGSSSWVKHDKSTFIYSQQAPTNILEQTKLNWSIYPNPCTTHFSVNIINVSGKMNLELFDSKGNKVMSSTLFNNAPVNIEYLPKGIYFFTIQSNKEYYQGQIIKN